MRHKEDNVWTIRGGIGSNLWIYFDLNINNYPEFKRFSNKEIFKVKAVIERVEWVSIYLNVDSVLFSESSDGKEVYKNKFNEKLVSSVDSTSSIFVNSTVHFGQGDIKYNNKSYNPIKEEALFVKKNTWLERLSNNQTFAIIFGSLFVLVILYFIFKTFGINLSQFR